MPNSGTAPGHGYFFEELAVGMTATFEKHVTDEDIRSFAEVSGDFNPAHTDDEFARGTRLGERVAHGMLTASLVSAVLGCELPGPGCLFVSQSTNFRAPVKPGETVTVSVTIERLDEKRKFAAFETRCTVGDTTVLDGTALVWVPSRKEETT